MADETTNRTNDVSGAPGSSLTDTPKSIGRATLVMIAAAALFVIIAIILMVKFFNAPTGDRGANSINSQPISVNNLREISA